MVHYRSTTIYYSDPPGVQNYRALRPAEHLMPRLTRGHIRLACICQQKCQAPHVVSHAVGTDVVHFRCAQPSMLKSSMEWTQKACSAAAARHTCVALTIMMPHGTTQFFLGSAFNCHITCTTSTTTPKLVRLLLPRRQLRLLRRRRAPTTTMVTR